MKLGRMWESIELGDDFRFLAHSSHLLLCCYSDNFELFIWFRGLQGSLSPLFSFCRVIYFSLIIRIRIGRITTLNEVDCSHLCYFGFQKYKKIRRRYTCSTSDKKRSTLGYAFLYQPFPATCYWIGNQYIVSDQKIICYMVFLMI